MKRRFRRRRSPRGWDPDRDRLVREMLIAPEAAQDRSGRPIYRGWYYARLAHYAASGGLWGGAGDKSLENGG